MTILFFITSKVAGNTIGVVEFVTDTGELTGIAFRGSCKIQCIYSTLHLLCKQMRAR